jgi:hypothetical protein
VAIPREVPYEVQTHLNITEVNGTNKGKKLRMETAVSVLCYNVLEARYIAKNKKLK